MTRCTTMEPEILSNGVGVCQQKCGSWSKVTSTDGKSKEVTVSCSKIEDGDKTVRPRPVCVPWVSLLLDSNSELSKSLEKLVESGAIKIRSLEEEISRLRLDNKSVLKSGLEIRGRLARSEKKLRDVESENAKLSEAVISEDLKRQAQWEELKKVQNFRKGKKQHEERLEKLQEKFDKLSARSNVLESENRRLKTEDVSKTRFIKSFELKVRQLEDEVQLEKTRNKVALDSIKERSSKEESVVS